MSGISIIIDYIYNVMLIDIDFIIVQNKIYIYIFCLIFLSEAKLYHRRLFKTLDLRYKLSLEHKHGFNLINGRVLMVC